MHRSVQPRDQIFVEGYGFFSFAKNTGKNIGKTTSKNLSGKYSQNILDHVKQSAKDAFKTASKKAIKKTKEEKDDFIGNKIADKITKVLKTLQQNKSEWAW